MLSQEEVLYIAELARISLTEEEVFKYQKDLSSVLAYFEQLKEVDTETVAPIGHITGMINVFREDKEEPFLNRSAIERNVPKKSNGFIQVKAVL